MEVTVKLDPEKWLPIFDDFNQRGSLGIGNSDVSLAIKAGAKVDKEFLWKQAEEVLLIDNAPQIVVMGHESKIGKLCVPDCDIHFLDWADVALLYYQNSGLDVVLPPTLRMLVAKLCSEFLREAPQTVDFDSLDGK